MSKRRVVVTGMGAVTPIGNSTAEFWSGIRAGKVGIGPITAFDTTNYKVKLAAEVKDFDAKEHMDFKTAKRMERFSQFAVAAAGEAFRDSGLDMEKEDVFRAGVIIGSGVGSLQEVESAVDRIEKKGPSRVNPLLVPRMIGNMAAGNVSIQLGFRGKCTNVETACATGSHCIGDAFRAIQYGDADIMAAGGAESCICPTGVAGFTALTALSENPDPMRASIPFDKDRGGFVIGEGAGVVILEELEHARARGAHIYAEVAGYGATGDAYHITSPIEDGSGAAKAMELAMEEAGAVPEDIDYIYLKVQVRGISYQYLYSFDGHTWQETAYQFDSARLSDEYIKAVYDAAFTGAFTGMFCVDGLGTGLHADFDYFSYKELDIEIDGKYI